MGFSHNLRGLFLFVGVIMLYKTIVIDPPWSYKSKMSGGNMKSGASHKYTTMDVNELCSMRDELRSIADPSGCVLYMWTTSPMMVESFKVWQAWGWKYKTKIVWDKERYGTGYWYRGQVEECWMGIIGKVPAYRSSFTNLIKGGYRGHSVKPEQFFEIVEATAPAPRCEIFARTHRPGWDVWGNEVESTIDFGKSFFREAV